MKNVLLLLNCLSIVATTSDTRNSTGGRLQQSIQATHTVDYVFALHSKTLCCRAQLVDYSHFQHCIFVEAYAIPELSFSFNSLFV